MTDLSKAEQSVPDLYELAFMPGQFRCPQCGFQWSIQTISVATGQIGTTEKDRQTPDCPNDGTRMVCVTYREQLEAYAERLKEEFEKNAVTAAERRVVEAAVAWHNAEGRVIEIATHDLMEAVAALLEERKEEQSGK